MIISWLCDILYAVYFCVYGKFIVPLQKKINTNFNVMKKTVIFFAMCLVGMCSMYAAHVAGAPILFYDVYAVMPCDDGHNGNVGGRPDPTQEIIGGIDGNDLNIGIGGDGLDAGEVVVIDPETGEIIIDEEPIVGQTSIHIPEPGSYTAYVTVGGTTYAGDFEVE